MESEGRKVFNEGRALNNSGDYGKAEACFRRAVELFRKDKESEGEHASLTWLATSLRGQHKWKEALGVLDKQMRPLTVAQYTERSDQYDTYLFGAVDFQSLAILAPRIRNRRHSGLRCASSTARTIAPIDAIQLAVSRTRHRHLDLALSHTTSLRDHTQRDTATNLRHSPTTHFRHRLFESSPSQ